MLSPSRTQITPKTKVRFIYSFANHPATLCRQPLLQGCQLAVFAFLKTGNTWGASFSSAASPDDQARGMNAFGVIWVGERVAQN